MNQPGTTSGFKFAVIAGGRRPPDSGLPTSAMPYKIASRWDCFHQTLTWRCIVYVEHPLREGWRLTDKTPKPVERTQNAYRFRIELNPRETAELDVGERRALMDRYQVSSLTPRDLELFVSRKYLDAASRTALEKIINIKAQIADVGAGVEAIDGELAEIAKDQERVRENIKAVGEMAEARQLITRYVTKVNQQETRIEQLTNERRAKAAARLQLQLQLETAIRSLALDRRL